MSEYGYVIYEDLNGDVIEEDNGYPTIEIAKIAAEKSCGDWIDRNPRGAYAWEVYDVDTDKTVGKSD